MKREAPAALRNLQPIAAVLLPLLADRHGDLLEIGSGTGQHSAGLAPQLPELQWWPSDPDPLQRESIDAWTSETGSRNLHPAFALDAASDWCLENRDGPRPPLTAIFSANVIHISPWEVTLGILRNAGRYLADDGLLLLYGPFCHDGHHHAPSNAEFDASLRSRDPAWGVRDLSVVAARAQEQGLRLQQSISMPANNHIQVFARHDDLSGLAREI